MPENIINRQEFMEVCPYGGYFGLNTEHDRPSLTTLIVFGMIMMKDNLDLLSPTCQDWLFDLIP